MVAHGRGDIELGIGVVQSMQPPKDRADMERPVQRVAEGIESRDADQQLQPEGQPGFEAYRRKHRYYRCREIVETGCEDQQGKIAQPPNSRERRGLAPGTKDLDGGNKK